jgi:tetratricopeptide (TPR) repeat protein
MALQAYDNCPCGSGKKLKFCCQKVAKYAERAVEMFQKGQPAAAMQSLEDGLVADPRNLWLRTLKLQMLLATHDHEAAQPLIADILDTNPGCRNILQIRLEDELSHGDAPTAAATLQQIIDAHPQLDDDSYIAMVILGRALTDLDCEFSALAHLRVASSSESLKERTQQALGALERDATNPPWLREPYELRPAPNGQAAERWGNAIALAATGRWQRALAIFELIAHEQPENPAVWFNLGLCQGWLAQQDNAAKSLEKYASLEQNDERAVDALALAQSLDPRDSAQSVDAIEIQYPIRDHSRLLQRLKDHARFQVHALDVQDDELGPGIKNQFYLLDKNLVGDLGAVTMENLPAVVGVVSTRGMTALLQFADPVPDDPRPALLIEAAGDSIDSNGVRSAAGTVPLSSYRMHRMWAIPAGTSAPDMRRVREMVHDRSLRDTWIDTPLGWLDNKTPREAAAIPELKLKLRAAILVIEYSCEPALYDIDMDGLRRSLGVDPEPRIEANGRFELNRTSLGRLRYVRVDGLPTAVLKAYFDRACAFALPIAMGRSAAALVARAEDRDQFDSNKAFHKLIESARRRSDQGAALKYVADARRFDAAAGLATEQPTWDIAEWEVSLDNDAPHEWAPRLAQLVKKMEANEEGTKELMLTLLRVGILRLVPHPSEPNRMILDGRMLEQILMRYSGPQSSTLDLTPVGGQPGKIWTPRDQIPHGRESAIVVPGQAAPAKPATKLVFPT